MLRILVIRFSSIGDIVLTSPVLRAIKKQKPDSVIHYVTKKSYEEVLKHNPYIDKIFLLNNSLKSLIADLRKEKYDLIIDLHKNLRSARIKSVLKAPSVTFDKMNFQKWLMVKLKKNRLPQKHIVDRYFEALQKFDLKNDQLGLEYYNGEEGASLHPTFEELSKEKFAAIVLGGTYYTKQIPEEKLTELLGKLEIKVALLGGPDDKILGEKLEGIFKGKAYNLAGKLNINQSAEVIRNSEFVVSGDTGLMHIAAAYQKKIYSVWGNTIPEFGMYPYMPQNPDRSVILQVDHLKCRPCSKLGYPNCPKKHFDCMIKQDFSCIQTK